MKTTKERIKIMLEIKSLVEEWLGYVKSYGNESAYTDSIIELIQEKANDL